MDKSYILSYFWKPVSNIQLVVFRVLFGLVMFGQSVYQIFNGWVSLTYIQPGYNFTFIGFEWLNVLHGKGMYYYYAGMAALSLMMAFGCLYRVSTIFLAILFTATYLSCKTYYNNHYYLMVLLCWLMAVMPANKRFSLDVKLNITGSQTHCYQWQLFLFMFQIACVYLFAALAKINADWLHAIPMKNWLQLKAGRPHIGHMLQYSWMPWLICYGGLLFDLLIIPGMLWRKTRTLFFLLAIGFHAFNGYVFQIGLFPLMSLTLFVFYFPASLFNRFLPRQNESAMMDEYPPNKRKVINNGVAIFIMLQLFLPIRHFFIPGPVSWTEEGHRMAWQMMLRSKRGNSTFKVKDKSNDSSWIIQPQSFIKKESLNEVATLPDVTWQAAQLLKQKYRLENMDVSVFANCQVSLNYRPYQPLIDSTIDLAAVKWDFFGHNPWVLLPK